MIGKTISHYRILEELGRGGMGVVYKAHDEKLDRPVALKVLKPELVGDKKHRQKFLREARSAAAVEHPFIASIHDADEADGTLFIAMEFVEGRTLRQLLRKGPLEIRDAVRYATEMAEGLATAHRAGLVHRDLKPDNVMIRLDGHAKLLDFGLAKLIERRDEATTLSLAQQFPPEATREGTILGTPAYMSPEQGRGEPVDHRTDIWSLGVVLYEMISGRSPFKGDYEQAIIYSIVNTDPETPRKIRPDIPGPLEDIVLRILRKDPKERFQTVDDLRGALDGFMASAGMAQRTEAPVMPVAHALKRPAVLVPAVLVVLALAAFLIQTVHKSNRTRWASVPS